MGMAAVMEDEREAQAARRAGQQVGTAMGKAGSMCASAATQCKVAALLLQLQHGTPVRCDAISSLWARQGADLCGRPTC